MKVSMSAVLYNLDGKTFNENGKDATLGDACVVALEANYADEKDISGAEKYARFDLVARIKAGGDVDLTVEEIAKLKTLLGKAFTVPVVGATYDALEGHKRDIPAPVATETSITEPEVSTDVVPQEAPAAASSSDTPSA